MKWILCAIVAMAILGAGVLICANVWREKSRRAIRQEEIVAFRQLGAHARRMLNVEGWGSESTNGKKFIKSFSSFQDYLADVQRIPKAPNGSSNPFPTILPNDGYKVSAAALGGPDSIVIESNLVFEVAGEKVRPAMRADGAVRVVGEGDHKDQYLFFEAD